MELGNQIKAHRAALSLSQEELAEKLAVTRQSVSKLSLIHISEPTRPY